VLQAVLAKLPPKLCGTTCPAMQRLQEACNGCSALSQAVPKWASSEAQKRSQCILCSMTEQLLCQITGLTTWHLHPCNTSSRPYAPVTPNGCRLHNCRLITTTTYAGASNTACDMPPIEIPCAQWPTEYPLHPAASLGACCMDKGSALH
jgi:hypothetical protein